MALVASAELQAQLQWLLDNAQPHSLDQLDTALSLLCAHVARRGKFPAVTAAQKRAEQLRLKLIRLVFDYGPDDPVLCARIERALLVGTPAAKIGGRP